MKVSQSQKIGFLLIVLIIFTLACSLAGGGATGGVATPTIDSVATVLAEVAKATQNAGVPQDTMPESTATQVDVQDEPADPTPT
ncbi:MAG TPA: hypothetical protein VJ965_03265, partial [Anaerolineales bacterium]|nr:hypothetical protein [Anaerolineales bacterium]